MSTDREANKLRGSTQLGSATLEFLFGSHYADGRTAPVGELRDPSEGEMGDMRTNGGGRSERRS